MAKTRTRTWTKTFTRTQALAFNINYVVRSTTGDTRFEELLNKGIVENQWINLIEVDGLDRNGNIHAQIVMTIDWDQHRLHITAHENVIEFDENLPEGERLDFAIGKIVQFFNRIVREEKLKPSWVLHYIPGIDEARAHKELDTIPSEPLKWATGEVVHVQKIYPEKLDEFSIRLFVLAPEGDPQDVRRKRRGKVKWFDEERGYGFIVPEDHCRDIFVHYSDIVGDGWRVLRPDELVEFETEDTSKGPQAVNVTRIDDVD